tara:strand:+ start:3440 stop:4078 length:639 start_codon:yes stop_codon:yes gene_type:complete
MLKHNIWVIKLGGSLIGSPYLGEWLAAIAAISRTARVVIVPGGGPFADAVRNAQSKLKVDDVVAHYMALLGMRQFGLALVALCKPLCTTALMSVSSIKAQASIGGICVWDPCDLHLDRSPLPKDWRVTSDSLSLWLCGELCDSRLLLVKSASPRSRHDPLSSLSESQFIDAYFPILRASIDRPGWWLESSHANVLADLVLGSQGTEEYVGKI